MKNGVRHRGILPGLAGLCALALAAGPAMARTHHYHHYEHDWRAPAGGPTSPGVSSILIDARSGAVLSGSGENVLRYPASLTKLMTLDLAFGELADGRLSLDTRIPVSYHAQSVEPVKLGLVAGQTISVRDAILAMTTMSANDAATALGEYLGGGSEQRCAEMMTARAHALGMMRTHFANASGLPNNTQVTTARDLAMLARNIVLEYPQFQSFFEVTSFDFEGREVYSNNQMLRLYPGATGMKTGYTDLARFNLVTSAVRGGRELIGVVLHEPNWSTSYAQMTAMLNDGFAGRFGAPQTELASAAPPPSPLPLPPPARLPLPPRWLAGGSMGGGYAAAPGAALASIAPALSLPLPPPGQVASRVAGLDLSHGTALPPPPPQRLPLPPIRLASLPLPPPARLPLPPPAAPVIRLASDDVPAHVSGGWVAQLGLYSRMSRARIAAIRAQQARGVGIARIARVQRHGRTLWTAQLAGLSYHAAHETCSLFAAHGAACHVLPPSADHLAMLRSGGGA